MFGQTNRRAFIAGLGGAVVWPLVARGQQSTMPVIGVLGSTSADAFAYLDAAYRQGLKDTGYVAGQNVTIEYLWANGQFDKLPALAVQLVRRRVAVILSAGGNTSALAAQAATATIPIVLGNVGVDPVKLGLVASLNQPGGNITGTAVLSSTLWSKRVELLHELVPTAKLVAVLVNPANPTSAAGTVIDTKSAASILGLQLRALHASTEGEIDEAFKELVDFQAGALAVSSDIFFAFRRKHLIELAVRYTIPAIYSWREDAEAGGLISYGANLAEAYRQAGIYTGRILRGEKPADLPVQQSTKFDMVINLKTAKALGLTIPPTLLALADKVIE